MLQVQAPAKPARGPGGRPPKPRLSIDEAKGAVAALAGRGEAVSSLALAREISRARKAVDPSAPSKAASVSPRWVVRQLASLADFEPPETILNAVAKERARSSAFAAGAPEVAA